VDEIELDKLSVKELRELKDHIELAIRAMIRQRHTSKAELASPVALAPVKVDLERERDAWMATRRQVKPL
jgi:hypothetical protein